MKKLLPFLLAFLLLAGLCVPAAASGEADFQEPGNIIEPAEDEDTEATDAAEGEETPAGAEESAAPTPDDEPAETPETDGANASGSVYASQLTEGEALTLKGDTSFVVDTDRTLRSISGSHTLTITIQSGKTLTVNNPDGHGISVSSLTVSGPGTLRVTASKDGLNTKNDISISCGSLVVDSRVDCIYASYGSITLNCDADLHSSGGMAIFARMDPLTLSGNITAVTTDEDSSCIRSGGSDGESIYAGHIRFLGGTFNITANGDAVCSHFGEMEITGKLNAVSNAGNAIVSYRGNVFGTYITNTVTINGAEIEARGKKNGIYCGGEIVIIDSEISASGSEYGIYAGKGFTIGANLVSHSGQIRENTIIASSGNPATQAVIGLPRVFFVVDGEQYATVKFAPGARVEPPDDPVKEKYAFTGWYTEPSCENLFDFSASPTETTTVLYAGWAFVLPELRLALYIPTEGQRMGDVTVFASNTMACSVTEVTWRDETAGRRRDEDDTFQAGHEYTASIYVECDRGKNGAVLANDGTGFTAPVYVNGEEVTLKTPNGESFDPQRAVISYTFTLSNGPIPGIVETVGRVVHYGEVMSCRLKGDAASLPAEILHYQWQISEDGGATWADVPGATAADWTTPAEGDTTIVARVIVTADGYTGSLVSNRHAINVYNPSVTEIEGTVTIMQGSIYETVFTPQSTPVKLSYKNSLGLEIQADSVRIQWQRSVDGSTWENIPGATERSYTPTRDDELYWLRVEVTDTHEVGALYSEAKQVGYVFAQYNVDYDMQGHGEQVQTQKNIRRGQPARVPTPDPTAEGFQFGGWYLDAECTMPYDFKSPVLSHMTLYAKWTEVLNPTVKLSDDGTSAQATNYTGLYARVALVIDINDVSGLLVVQPTINDGGLIVIPSITMPGLTVKGVSVALVPTLEDIQKSMPDVKASDMKMLG